MEEPSKCFLEHSGFQVRGDTSSSMEPRHMRDQIMKKAHCLQTIGKVVPRGSLGRDIRVTLPS